MLIHGVGGTRQNNRHRIVEKQNRRRFRFKTPHLFLLLGLIATVHSFAAEPYCISVNGGFGDGGTAFTARSFSLPAESRYLTVGRRQYDKRYDGCDELCEQGFYGRSLSEVGGEGGVGKAV